MEYIQVLEIAAKVRNLDLFEQGVTLLDEVLATAQTRPRLLIGNEYNELCALRDKATESFERYGGKKLRSMSGQNPCR